MRLPEETPKTVSTELVLQLVASLQLADLIGDVMDYVANFLKKAGIELEESNTAENLYWDALVEMGVTTLYGTALSPRDEDEE